MELKKIGSLAVLIAGFLPLASQAVSVYDESVDGDLSNDHLNPTSIGLNLGLNEISGGTSNTPSLDRDFFTVTIAAGQVLESMILQSYTNTDNQSFLGFEVGSGFTDLNGSGPTFNFALVGEGAGTQQGDDVLDDLAGGPLGAGTYSFWAQETAGDTTYTYGLQVTAVPVPAALPLLASGLLVVRLVSRKRLLS